MPYQSITPRGLRNNFVFLPLNSNQKELVWALNLLCVSGPVTCVGQLVEWALSTEFWLNVTAAQQVLFLANF